MGVRRIAGLPQKVESSYCSRPEAPQPGCAEFETAQGLEIQFNPLNPTSILLPIG